MSAKKKVTLYAARAGNKVKVSEDFVRIFRDKPTFEKHQVMSFNPRTGNYEYKTLSIPQTDRGSETVIDSKEYRRATGKAAPKLGEVRKIELVLDADRRTKGNIVALKMDEDGFGIHLKKGNNKADVAYFCGLGFNAATGFEINTYDDSTPHTLAIREA